MATEVKGQSLKWAWGRCYQGTNPLKKCYTRPTWDSRLMTPNIGTSSTGRKQKSVLRARQDNFYLVLETVPYSCYTHFYQSGRTRILLNARSILGILRACKKNAEYNAKYNVLVPNILYMFFKMPNILYKFFKMQNILYKFFEKKNSW